MVGVVGIRVFRPLLLDPWVVDEMEQRGFGCRVFRALEAPVLARLGNGVGCVPFGRILTVLRLGF